MGGAPAQIPTAKLCLLEASGFLQEGSLHPPACTHDPTRQSRDSSEPPRSPLLWGAVMVGGAAHPFLSRQVPAFAVPALMPREDAALPLCQHGVKGPLPHLLHGCLEGPGPTNPSRAAPPSWSSTGMGDGVIEQSRA